MESVPAASFSVDGQVFRSKTEPLFFSRASQPRTAQLVNEEKCAVCFFSAQSRLLLNGDYGDHSDGALPHGGLRGTVYCLMILFAHRISEDLTVT